MSIRTRMSYALVLVLTLAGVLWATYAISSLTQERPWLIPLTIGLYVMFFMELWQRFKGLEGNWVVHRPKDKFLFSLSLVFLYGLVLLPVKMRWQLGWGLLSFAMGYGISWLVVHLWGSDELRRVWLWPRS